MRFAFLALLVASALAHTLEEDPLSHVRVERIRIPAAMEQGIAVQLPSVLSAPGFVTVSFSGVSSPNHDDWIAMYLENENVTTVVPVKYQYCSVSNGYLTSGSGTLQFRLLNQRSNYLAYFFRGGISQPTLGAVSNVMRIPNPNEPLAGRLTLTATAGQMAISWTTRDVNGPQVMWGTTAQSLSQKANGVSVFGYKANEMCGAPATTIGYRSPGNFHTAVMTNLPPSTRIYYSYGSSAGGFSPVASFVTPPPPNSPINIVAFGDLGEAPLDDSQQWDWWGEFASRNTTNNIQTDPQYPNTQLIYLIGDLSYAHGYEAQWEFFHDQVLPMTTTIPWMVGIGNHERDWPNSGSATGGFDSGGECGVPYERRFPMPISGHDKPWYSFNFGMVHFITMSTEHWFNRSSEQYQFFVSDLAAVNRKQTPWIIFSGHRPFYIDSTNWAPNGGDQTVAEAMRASFEDLLYQNQVDVIFGAHHHSYQRTCPVYKGQCMSPGANGYAAPVIWNIGMSGASNSNNIEPVQPAIFKVVDDSHHGYTRVRANAQSLTIDYYREDKKIFDTYTLQMPSGRL